MISYAKREIIDAVIKIINQQGVRGLTMSKVASRVGIAKGTLYLYFDNKEDLIESAIQISLEPLVMAQEELIESDLSPDKKLERIVEVHLDFFEKHKSYFRVLIYEHQRSQEPKKRFPKKRFIDNKHQQLLKRIGKVIEEGIEKDLFRSYDPGMLAVMFIESLIGLTLQKIVQEEDECNLKEAGRAFTDVIFNGIKAETKD